MSADIEGRCGAVARADAVRQVVMMKEICGREAEVREKANELTMKDEEIRQLQQQLQHERVYYFSPTVIIILFTCTVEVTVTKFNIMTVLIFVIS